MSGKGGKGKTPATKAAKQPAQAPPAAPAKAAPKPAPKAAPKPASPKAKAPIVTPELVAQKKALLESLSTSKVTMARDAKAADEELAKLLKTPKARVQGTVAQLEEEAKNLEFRRTTTSMSLNEEKRVLKDLEAIKVRKVQVTEYEEFQATVQTLKDKKNELYDTLRATETHEKLLQAEVRKMQLALELHTTLDAFETITISVPKDKMGMVVGKNYTKLRQFEETYHVLLDVENGTQDVKATSVPKQNALVLAAINNIALATTQSLAVHPDVLKLLMIQKGLHLKALEAKCDVKIDVQRAENTISFQASPERTQLLEATLKSLNTNKATIDLPTDVIPKLIGKKGEVISKIMEDTGALLDIDRVTNCVHIVGPAESVLAAQASVDAIIHDQAASAVKVNASDVAFFGRWDASQFPAFVEYLMGDKAAKLKALRKEALDIRLQVNKNKNRFDVDGNRHQIEALKGAIQAAVASFLESVHTFDVDERCLSLIIGKKGAKIKAIEAESGAKVDIQGHTLYILGEADQIQKATALVDEIVAKNQRSVVYTSSHLTGLLLNNKRAKLNEIEKASGCNVQLPPAPAGGKAPRTKATTMAITLTGTTSAIQLASTALEALNDENKVVYLPLDGDEVATVIGKKGETIMKLEKDTGCRLRVLDDVSEGSRELELMGTADQVAAATSALDGLLRTSARQLLNLDEFSVACLIGKKGERIKEVRAAHPKVTLDTFQKSQVVRIQGNDKADVDACAAAILDLLQNTTVFETIKAGGRGRFDALLSDPTIALHLAELEAQGGVKASVQENGTQVKLRGSPLGIAKLKSFFDMLADTHCIASIPLASKAHATSLRGSTDDSLHENVLQVVKQTKTVIRIKADKSSPSGFAVSLEGASLAKVLDAKLRVESLLQFFFPSHVKVLSGVSASAVPRLFQSLPLLGAYHATLSLASKDSIKIITDSEANTKTVHKKLEEILKAHDKEYHEMTIPGHLVPQLVGKNGESIKRLSSESHATLNLSPADADDPWAARSLTIHSRDEANVKAAVRLVQELLHAYEAECASVVVPLTLLDAAMGLKRQSPSGVSFNVQEKTDLSATIQIHAKNATERASTVAKLQELVATTTVLQIVLPSTDIVGSLIGKGGANIKTLQSMHSGLQVDIRRAEKDGAQSKVSLRGEKAAVAAAAVWVREKIAAIVAMDAEKRAFTKPKPEKAAAPVDAPVEAPIETPAKPTRHVPVGAPAAMDKNARRRQRKREEKEQADAAAAKAAKGVLSPRAHYGPKSDFFNYLPPGSK
ncbi:hypothetical protein SPRG_02598 [Saprolegnia parasitica CBS 223.65]|uniref:K Homology domain-containing protein n=2 Tax=Saprolegnia parasitica (strain CBS 223.65) TaxID=695850 RepID=A0A067D1J7_SAPPC|nr:hypothetical protein SPRG_02598 [Saprolegnia parasitica CBS 223.65]KDO32907.1 hypothetical protein SPRG_02598 [Saprolegnia parasitica CBS 223.65]|eukprot:XP_012196556.1 hypothetical protein SPRG_02598 [Saprolegnia parasitica CBS 223.65]